MRSSVASRNRIGPTQHRPIGCGKGFEARRQSACYHTSAGSSACRRKTGQGTGLGERFHGAKSGSHSTLPLVGARFDIEAYGVKEDAALPEDAGTVFVR